MRQGKAGLLKPDPVWNRFGPPIPLWFKRQLKWIDPELVLQFIPPHYTTEDGSVRGVPPELYPFGVWSICKKLKRTGLLHPRTVWCLADLNGVYSPPGPDTIRILRLAYNLQRRGNMDKLETMMDESIAGLNQARCERSLAKLQQNLQKFCSVTCDRQWSNRVIMRRDIPREKVA